MPIIRQVRRQVQDVTGERIGRLVATHPTNQSRNGKVIWTWRCDCGNTLDAVPYRLRRTKYKSCGCVRNEMIAAIAEKGVGQRNPMSYTYAAYRALRKSKKEMVPEWDGHYLVFLEHMGERPKGSTLVRPDPLKPFGPGNCRWEDIESRTSESGNFLTWEGVTLTQAGWARRLGISETTMSRRLERKLTGAALFAPKKSFRQDLTTHGGKDA